MGRHVAEDSSTFLRDLAVMVVGILAVGGAVFGGLWLLARNGDGPTSVAGTELSTTSAPSTSVASTTTTSTTTTSTTTTSTTTPVRPPGEVTVLVLNSVGTSGIAGRLTDKLATAGYKTLKAANYQPKLARSAIWYRTGFGREALELVTYVPDAGVEENEQQVAQQKADIVIVLGSSYQE